MKRFFKNVIVAILTLEARVLLKRTKPRIVAVTGSVGKTSIKDAVYEVVKRKLHVRKSEKSFNSEIGVPLSVLGLPNAWNSPWRWLKNIIDGAVAMLHPGEYPELLILEMGVDKPGDMERLTSWVRPDVVILTRLPDVPVHVEFFSSPEAVAVEKEKLVRALKLDGVFVFNRDDERVVAVAGTVEQRSLSYGMGKGVQFAASEAKVRYGEGRAVGFEFVLSHGDRSVTMDVVGSLGVQHAYNYAAAAAVASVFDIGIDAVRDALLSYTPPPGRMRLIPGIKETLIIDDTYNSSPAASERSLATLGELRGVKRRIAVLGDMMELGQFSIREHERIGKLVPKAAHLLVTVGIRARGFAKGAREAGMDERKILEFNSAPEAARELQPFIKPGDVLLVKGSQSMRAERFVEDLMAEPERAEELLVRQDPVWRAIP